VCVDVLHVSFAKEPYKRDDILQKRPIILRSLLIVATPYVDEGMLMLVPSSLSCACTLPPLSIDVRARALSRALTLIPSLSSKVAVDARLRMRALTLSRALDERAAGERKRFPALSLPHFRRRRSLSSSPALSLSSCTREKARARTRTSTERGR